MKNLVTIDNGQPVTTSLLVAEIFKRRHDNVLRDIESLSCSDEFRLLNFEETPYTHPQNGQTYKMYRMTKDGFSFLVMGYNGEKAGEFKELFIREFNKRTAMLQSDDYILARSQEILLGKVKTLESKVAQQQEVLEIKNKQIEGLQQDADYTRKVLTSKDTFTTTQIAKELGMGAPTLNKKLRRAGVQYKQNDQWLLSYKYQDKGYTKVNTYSETINGETRTYHYSVWTEKGRQFIHNLLNLQPCKDQ